ncbi:alpha/beta hydrolase family protein [Rhodococcoides yunnanense]|uniref:alpha/beta hydrolase family protein n=1 Tax=Rhodococcoides yunnanense TaxID=278209 RepID=UPI000933FA7B|nr:alpha/beta family hydrolase [Rhodococcus yunnanensis]
MTDHPHGITVVEDADVRGFLHAPPGQPVGALALTHGAGGNCDARILVDIADRWSSAGLLVLRFDLAFRRSKPKGPPHSSKADTDRASIVSAARRLADLAAGTGPLLVGGHSYGGRQASMICAEQPDLAQGLLLLSYPLHPPGKPEKARTAHLPDITVPTFAVSGTRDPFGAPEELRDALALVPARTELVLVDGAGHDLSAAKHAAAKTTVTAASTFFALATRDRTATSR